MIPSVEILDSILTDNTLLVTAGWRHQLVDPSQLVPSPFSSFAEIFLISVWSTA